MLFERGPSMHLWGPSTALQGKRAEVTKGRGLGSERATPGAEYHSSSPVSACQRCHADSVGPSPLFAGGQRPVVSRS